MVRALRDLPIEETIMFILSGRTELPSRPPCECCPPWAMGHAIDAGIDAATRAKAKAKANVASRASQKAKTRRPAAPPSPNSIDVHHHISPPAYIKAIGPENMVNSYPASRVAAYDWTPAMAIEMMDKGGTAIVNGIGLGFANRVRRGAVGIVGASGTGLQTVASRVHHSIARFAASKAGGITEQSLRA